MDGASGYDVATETRLTTSVLADVMDDLGRRDQTLDRTIRPLFVDEVPAEPFRLELALLDSLVPGDPRELEAEVVRRALAKLDGEDAVRGVLADGASIGQVFEQYGVL